MWEIWCRISWLSTTADPELTEKPDKLKFSATRLYRMIEIDRADTMKQTHSERRAHFWSDLWLKGCLCGGIRLASNGHAHTVWHLGQHLWPHLVLLRMVWFGWRVRLSTIGESYVGGVNKYVYSNHLAQWIYWARFMPPLTIGVGSWPLKECARPRITGIVKVLHG